MAIPDFQSIMLPLLRVMGDGAERRTAAIRGALAGEFNLTDDELTEQLPSGTQRVFVNRVAWALAYLKRAGLLTSHRRAHYQITPRGLEVLKSPPDRISIKFLGQFDEFQGFRSGEETSEQSDGSDVSSGTPEEDLDRAYKELRSALEQEMLELVKACSSTFFEQLVVDLMVAMGYGGTRLDAGQAIGRSGDEGIDGVIKEDRLGLEAIYLQAKKWEGTVGRPEVQKFAGALQGKKARKGVLITTSSFSAEARAFAARLETRIVLLDGKELARYMVEHGVGVTAIRSYEVNRIDQDYFVEE